jgi:hypothetical protein
MANGICVCIDIKDPEPYGVVDTPSGGLHEIPVFSSKGVGFFL